MPNDIGSHQWKWKCRVIVFVVKRNHADFQTNFFLHSLCTWNWYLWQICFDFFRLSFCVLFLMFSTLRFDWYINHWARVQSNDADLQVRASTQPRSSSIWLLFSSLFSLFIFFSARDNERLTQFCLALLFELLLLIFFFVTFYECIVVS